MLPVAKVYHVPSDSNPSKRWEVLERTDGSLSCSCPVWVFNKRKTEPRSCKHTEQVKGGLIEPTTTYQETTVERTRRAEKVVEHQRGYTSPREQEIMGRRRQREDSIDRNARRNRPAIARVLGNDSEEVASNARKLATIKERLSKDGNMDVFPTKRKVNW